MEYHVPLQRVEIREVKRRKGGGGVEEIKCKEDKERERERKRMRVVFAWIVSFKPFIA